MTAPPRPATTQLEALTVQNVGSLKVLNAKLFPVAYQDSFYSDLLEKRLASSRLVFFHDCLVGNVCTRVEAVPESTDKRIYIMTLGVLRPYRNRGIGKAALDFVLDEVAKSSPDIVAVRLHVQTSNEDALAFYKKAGFEVVETVEQYFKRLDDNSAHLLEKKL